MDARKKLQALEQLAMLYEHQMKDFEQATSYTMQGLQLIAATDELRDEQKKKWEKRLKKTI